MSPLKPASNTRQSVPSCARCRTDLDRPEKRKGSFQLVDGGAPAANESKDSNPFMVIILLHLQLSFPSVDSPCGFACPFPLHLEASWIRQTHRITVDMGVCVNSGWAT